MIVLPNPVLELHAVFHVVLAQQVVDDLHLGDVIGTADEEALDVSLLEQLPGCAVGNAAQHGAELVDGDHIGKVAESLFVISSCHDHSPIIDLSMADDLASFDLLRPLLRFRPSNDLHLPTFCRSFSVSPAVAVAVDFWAFSVRFSLKRRALSSSPATSGGFHSPPTSEKSVLLKIRWWRHRVGSSPTTGTMKKALFVYQTKALFSTKSVLSDG